MQFPIFWIIYLQKRSGYKKQIIALWKLKISVLEYFFHMMVQQLFLLLFKILNQQVKILWSIFVLKIKNE